VAKSLEIPDKTAQNYISKYLKKGLIHRDKQDFYIKTPAKDVKDLGDC
jgi:Fic family protein